MIRLVFDHKSRQNDGEHGGSFCKNMFFLRREDSVPAQNPGQKTGLKIREKGAFCNFKTSSFRRSNSLRSKTSPLGCQRWQSSKTCQNFDPDMGRWGFRSSRAISPHHLTSGSKRCCIGSLSSVWRVMDLQMGGGLSLDKWPNYSYSPTAIEELPPHVLRKKPKTTLWVIGSPPIKC